MLIKILVKHLILVKVSSLIITFFNWMDMSDYENKHKRYFGTEQKLRGKVGHTLLYTLSPITIDGDGQYCR